MVYSVIVCILLGSLHAASAQLTPDDIAKTIGTFANYKGINQQPIYGNSLQSFFAKQLIEQLKPTDDWQTSALTNLHIPLAEQSGTVTIGTRNNKQAEEVFGRGEHSITIASLQTYAASADITVHSSLLTPELYTAITTLPLKKQDTRTLATIIGNNAPQWLNNTGVTNNNSAYSSVLEIPLMLLASSICHAQEILFFVEQALLDNDPHAYNALKTDNLARGEPVTLLSIPGLNVAYSGIKQEDLIICGDAHNLIKNMWETLFASAQAHNARIVVIPAIGLGAFAGNNPEALAHIYFETLQETLRSHRFKNAFDRVYYNPTPRFAPIFASYCDNTTMLRAFAGDTKFLAIELAKANYRCALVNPSDADVIWGLYDIGEYYKNGHYVGEEDIAATSTAILGSKGINPHAYTTIKTV